MDDLLVRCDGTQAGSVWIPPFVLRRGSWLCLHMPSPACDRLMGIVVDLLTARGAQTHPGLTVHGQIRWAQPPTLARGLFALFHNPRGVDWLMRKGRLTRPEAG